MAIKADTEAVAELEGTALELLEDLAEVAEEVQQLENPKAEAEKTVMNFFKTFVSRIFQLLCLFDSFYLIVLIMY